MTEVGFFGIYLSLFGWFSVAIILAVVIGTGIAIYRIKKGARRWINNIFMI